MGSSIGSVTTVRIGGITVRLDVSGVWALEAGRAGCELHFVSYARTLYMAGKLTPDASQLPTLYERPGM